MSIRVDSNSLIPGAVVCGNQGLGVLGRDIPSTGEHGPALAYLHLDLPADAGKEIRVLVTSAPAGTLVHEDTSFDMPVPADGRYSIGYNLYADGVLQFSDTAIVQVGP